MKDHFRRTILRISEKLSHEDKQALADWLEALLLVRRSKSSQLQKLREIARSLKRHRSLWPVIREISREGKRLGWDERQGGFRAFLTVSLGTILFFGFQGVGIAAFGGAMALPLWVVFGGGASAAYSLIIELRASNKRDQD